MTAEFVWHLPEAFRLLGRLPIRLRDMAGDVVASGVSGEPLAVPSGRYLLCVILPNGREIIGGIPFEVGSEPPMLAAEMARAFDVAGFMAGPVGCCGEARRWEGRVADAWRGGRLVLDATVPVELGATLFPTARGHSHDTILLRKDAAGWTASLIPEDRRTSTVGGSKAILAGAAVDTAGLVLRSGISGGANTLIAYVERGLLREARCIADAVVPRHTDEDSVLEALTAMYVLLRANDLDAVDGVLDRLLVSASDVPDTYAICAEVRARQGRHEAAVAALRTGCDLGCPWFRSGVSYLLERLRLYLEVDAGPSSFTLRPDDRNRGRAWKEWLERIALRLDTRATFTSFRMTDDVIVVGR